MKNMIAGILFLTGDCGVCAYGSQLILNGGFETGTLADWSVVTETGSQPGSVEEYGEAGGNRYAVKRYRASNNPDPNTRGDRAWLHERITLESLNSNYPPWDIASARKVDVIGEFVFTMPSATPRT
jgi:hypothetical protein